MTARTDISTTAAVKKPFWPPAIPGRPSPRRWSIWLGAALALAAFVPGAYMHRWLVDVPSHLYTLLVDESGASSPGYVSVFPGSPRGHLAYWLAGAAALSVAALACGLAAFGRARGRYAKAAYGVILLAGVAFLLALAAHVRCPAERMEPPREPGTIIDVSDSASGGPAAIDVEADRCRVR